MWSRRGDQLKIRIGDTTTKWGEKVLKPGKEVHINKVYGFFTEVKNLL